MNDGSAGWQFSTNNESKLFIDESYVYLINTQDGQLRVYNKITGLPSTEHPRVNDGSAGWSFRTDNESQFFIDESYVYLLNTQTGQLRVYNKITGLPSTEHPRVNDGSAGWSFRTDIRSHFFIESALDNYESWSYYSIYVCGYGLNNSIKRIQSIISVETTNKTIKQISWREVF